MNRCGLRPPLGSYVELWSEDQVGDMLAKVLTLLLLAIPRSGNSCQSVLRSGAKPNSGVSNSKDVSKDSIPSIAIELKSPSKVKAGSAHEKSAAASGLLTGIDTAD